MKDEPISDSEITSRRRPSKADDGSTTPDNTTPDDERDTDYEPPASGVESELVDVGTNSFRKFRTSRRLKKKPCCFTPVKKTRSGGKSESLSGGGNNGGCGGGGGGGASRGGCPHNEKVRRPLRIVLRGKQSLTRKSPRRKIDEDDNGEEEPGEGSSSNRAMRLRKRKEGAKEDEDEHRDDDEDEGEKEKASVPKKISSRDKLNASPDDRELKRTTTKTMSTKTLSNDFTPAFQCQDREEEEGEEETSKTKSLHLLSNSDEGESVLNHGESGLNDSHLEEATIVAIQSVRIVEQHGSEG